MLPTSRAQILRRYQKILWNDLIIPIQHTKISLKNLIFISNIFKVVDCDWNLQSSHYNRSIINIFYSYYQIIVFFILIHYSVLAMSNSIVTGYSWILQYVRYFRVISLLKISFTNDCTNINLYFLSIFFTNI